MAGKPPSSPKRRQRAWARAAVLLAFGAGIVSGGAALTAMQEGFDPMLGLVGGGGLFLLVVANVLATRRLEVDDGDQPRLPGERFKDRSKPDPHTVQQGELDGVPFSESKKVTKRRAGGNGRVEKLHERLDKVNKELQRANVKLGLGELSEEGYSKIVERLKERRAKLEDELNKRG